MSTSGKAECNHLAPQLRSGPRLLKAPVAGPVGSAALQRVRSGATDVTGAALRWFCQVTDNPSVTSTAGPAADVRPPMAEGRLESMGRLPADGRWPAIADKGDPLQNPSESITESEPQWLSCASMSSENSSPLPRPPPAGRPIYWVRTASDLPWTSSYHPSSKRTKSVSTWRTCSTSLRRQPTTRLSDYLRIDVATDGRAVRCRFRARFGERAS